MKNSSMLFVTAIFIAVSAYLVLPSFAEVYMTSDATADMYAAGKTGIQGCYTHKTLGCVDGYSACAKRATPPGKYGTWACNSANSCTCEFTQTPGGGNTAPMGNMF